MNERLRFLEWALQGNGDAIALCESLAFVAHLWDDVVDRDVALDEDRVNRAFWTALIDVPANPFYQRHQHRLAPVMRQIAVDWMEANQLEREGRHERTIAFTLRSGINGFVVQCAYIVGGFDWMREVSRAVRRQWHTETLDEYIAEQEGQ